MDAGFRRAPLSSKPNSTRHRALLGVSQMRQRFVPMSTLSIFSQAGSDEMKSKRLGTFEIAFPWRDAKRLGKWRTPDGRTGTSVSGTVIPRRLRLPYRISTLRSLAMLWNASPRRAGDAYCRLLGRGGTSSACVDNSRLNSILYFYRALSRSQPFLHSRDCGIDRDKWLWARSGRYFFDLLDDPYWRLRYGLRTMPQRR